MGCARPCSDVSALLSQGLRRGTIALVAERSVQVDVAIVGARVAGSVAATVLGEAGYQVLVVDGATFPSDTISTHFFRGAGLGSVLVRLGLLDEVLAAGCPPLTCQYLFSGDDPTPQVGGPQGPGDLGYALSMRRLPFDDLLVRRARAAPGVTIWEATPARALVRGEDGRVTGLIVEHGGQAVHVEARLVVGADGRGSSVVRWVEPPVERREPAARALYYQYVRGFRGPGGTWDGPEFSVRGDEMVYVFPSDDDVACVAVSVNLETFAAVRSNVAGVFQERIAAHPGVAPRYRDARPESRVLGSGPKDAIIRTPSGPGWALVGDASLVQDPWTGLGMDNAGVHATFLAEAVDDWLSGRRPEVDAFATYAQRRADHAIGDFEYTATYGRDLSQL